MPDPTLPGDLPLLMVRGITFGPITITIKDGNGVVINLTNYTVRGVARPEIPSPNQYDLAPTIGSPATDGKVVITFTDENTEKLFPVGVYDYNLDIIDGSGAVVAPSVIAGKLTVIDQPARS